MCKLFVNLLVLYWSVEAVVAEVIIEAVDDNDVLAKVNKIQISSFTLSNTPGLKFRIDDIPNTDFFLDGQKVITIVNYKFENHYVVVSAVSLGDVYTDIPTAVGAVVPEPIVSSLRGKVASGGKGLSGSNNQLGRAVFGCGPEVQKFSKYNSVEIPNSDQCFVTWKNVGILGLIPSIEGGTSGGAVVTFFGRGIIVGYDPPADGRPDDTTMTLNELTDRFEAGVVWTAVTLAPKEDSFPFSMRYGVSKYSKGVIADEAGGDLPDDYIVVSVGESMFGDKQALNFEVMQEPGLDHHPLRLLEGRVACGVEDPVKEELKGMKIFTFAPVLPNCRLSISMVEMVGVSQIQLIGINLRTDPQKSVTIVIQMKITDEKGSGLRTLHLAPSVRLDKVDPALLSSLFGGADEPPDWEDDEEEDAVTVVQPPRPKQSKFNPKRPKTERIKSANKSVIDTKKKHTPKEPTGAPVETPTSGESSEEPASTKSTESSEDTRPKVNIVENPGKEEKERKEVKKQTETTHKKGTKELGQIRKRKIPKTNNGKRSTNSPVNKKEEANPEVSPEVNASSANNIASNNAQVKKKSTYITLTTSSLVALVCGTIGVILLF